MVFIPAQPSEAALPTPALSPLTGGALRRVVICLKSHSNRVLASSSPGSQLVLISSRSQNLGHYFFLWILLIFSEKFFIRKWAYSKISMC